MPISRCGTLLISDPRRSILKAKIEKSGLKSNPQLQKRQPDDSHRRAAGFRFWFGQKYIWLNILFLAVHSSAAAEDLSCDICGHVACKEKDHCSHILRLSATS